MSQESEVLKDFLNYKQYRSDVISLVDFVDSLLSPEQKKFFEIKYGGETIDFKTQLLIYFVYRYRFSIDIWQLKQKAVRFFKKYEFLFTEKELDSNQIRIILLRELMEVISLGFQCYQFQERGCLTIWELERNLYRNLAWPKIKDTLKSKYPNLPSIEGGGYQDSAEFYNQCFWSVFYLSSDIYKTLWYSEFFKRTKWYLEKLNVCDQDFVNKYREKYYQIACISIGKDIDLDPLPYNYSFKHRCDRCRIVKSRDIKNTFLQEIVEDIVGYFEDAELEKFKKIDSQGEDWSFKEQLFDRYYPRFPSFASLEEIKKQIEKKVLKYRSLLTSEHYEIYLELFMDELEKELFVSSRATYIWNEKMFKNLKIQKEIRVKKRDAWVIDQILRLINFENIEIAGHQYNLKTLLIARWGRARLKLRRMKFNEKILFIFTKSLYHPSNWDQQGSPQINLQIFLEEVDSCFKYPDRLFTIKEYFRQCWGFG